MLLLSVAANVFGTLSNAVAASVRGRFFYQRRMWGGEVERKEKRY